MMFPVQGSFVCKKCGHVKGAEGVSDDLVSKSQRKDREVTVLEENFDQGLPTTSSRCPECGHNVAYWWLALRSQMNLKHASSNAPNAVLHERVTGELSSKPHFIVLYIGNFFYLKI
jgi:predicted RNA-binding Zn-ribbon protein involved in translation (DUF1610 family)